MNSPVSIQEFSSQISKQKQELRAILPDHIPVDRFIKTAMLAVQTDPTLLTADRQSLFISLQMCASDGLLPDGREAALVIYNTKSGKKVRYTPMVDGVLKRARQSGEVSMITARIVYAGDEFDYWVDENGEHLRHRPNFADRGEMVLVYAIARMRSGELAVETMTMDDVARVRAIAHSDAWKNWFDRMALKSVLHRLSRRLPNSSEIMEVLARDHWMYDLEGRAGRTEAEKEEPEQIQYYPDDQFEKNFPAWKNVIESGRRSAEQIIAMIESKAALTDDQKEKILSLEEATA